LRHSFGVADAKFMVAWLWIRVTGHSALTAMLSARSSSARP
jgi:hypothetical protein